MNCNLPLKATELWQAIYTFAKEDCIGSTSWVCFTRVSFIRSSNFRIQTRSNDMTFQPVKTNTGIGLTYDCGAYAKKYNFSDHAFSAYFFSYMVVIYSEFLQISVLASRMAFLWTW